MSFRGWPALLLAVTSFALGCGEDAEPTVDTSSGPKLGDECRATTAIDSVVEVVTVKGPLECSEAQSVLGAYYSNTENARGSGGGLEVEAWFCISAPLPEAPLAGRCTEEDGREFKMYSVEDAPASDRDQLEQELETRLEADGILEPRRGSCVLDRLIRLGDRDLERATDPSSDTFAVEVGIEAQLVCAGVPPDLTKCITKQFEPLIAERGPQITRAEFAGFRADIARIRGQCLGPPDPSSGSPLGPGYPPPGQCGTSPETGDPICVNPDGSLRYDDSAG